MFDHVPRTAVVTTHLVDQVEKRVGWLTLNRPERLNAFTPEMLAALEQALRRRSEDPGIGALVLTGAGRGFCSGGDVARMTRAASAPAASADDPEAVRALRRRMEVARLLHEAPVPTVAMVNGVAAGAGLSLALACDLRLAGESARFTPAFARVGLPGDFGGSYFLSRLVGTARAREIYFTNAMLSAHQALALGIVSRVVPDVELRGVTQALAEELARGPRIALALMKRNFNAAEHASLAEMLDLEASHQIEATRTFDHQEAARAFVEKRPPRFQGR
jgi:2-(1,2-epoxy-1,2-dihydrophenyl)acetyl-CoA isomerase